MIAVRTGISPVDLLATEPEILAAMIDELFPRGNIKTGEDAWQALGRMATG